MCTLKPSIRHIILYDATSCFLPSHSSLAQCPRHAKLLLSSDHAYGDPTAVQLAHQRRQALHGFVDAAVDGPRHLAREILGKQCIYIYIITYAYMYVYVYVNVNVYVNEIYIYICTIK